MYFDKCTKKKRQFGRFNVCLLFQVDKDLINIVGIRIYEIFELMD